MTDHLLRNLIAHVITELTDMSASFGKTKLVKLLYLIDVEHYRIRRTTISGLEWRFYHYGPYASEIDTALNELELDIPQDPATIGTGQTAIVFRPNRRLNPRLVDYLSSLSELRLVNKVVRDWGETDLNPLLNHVYFYTEPMRHAERDEILDFSTIQPRQGDLTVSRRVTLPTDRAEEFKLQLQAAKANRVYRPLDPAPRFDSVYRDGLSRMTAEELHGITIGSVEMSVEAKESLRDQGDDEIGG